jgi:hypothetical protein
VNNIHIDVHCGISNKLSFCACNVPTNCYIRKNETPSAVKNPDGGYYQDLKKGYKKKVVANPHKFSTKNNYTNSLAAFVGKSF